MLLGKGWLITLTSHSYSTLAAFTTGILPRVLRVFSTTREPWWLYCSLHLAPIFCHLPPSSCSFYYQSSCFPVPAAFVDLRISSQLDCWVGHGHKCTNFAGSKCSIDTHAGLLKSNLLPHRSFPTVGFWFQSFNSIFARPKPSSRASLAVVVLSSPVIELRSTGSPGWKV